MNFQGGSSIQLLKSRPICNKRKDLRIQYGLNIFKHFFGISLALCSSLECKIHTETSNFYL